MICTGRKNKDPLKFNECAERAQKYHTSKSWLVALSYYSAMLELTERTVGLFHSQVGNILQVMATCYKMLEKYEEAAQCLQRVIIVRELENANSSDPEAGKVAFNTMGQMAELYLSAGNATFAKDLLIKMEEGAKESFGDDSFEKGRVLCALGGCLERLGEVDEAVATLQRALAVKAYGECTTQPEMVATSNCHFNLAVLYFNQEKKNDAETHFNASLELKKKGGVTLDHPDCVEIQEYLKKLEAM